MEELFSSAIILWLIPNIYIKKPKTIPSQRLTKDTAGVCFKRDWSSSKDLCADEHMHSCVAISGMK
jgi:hypothetical protein